jgi:hypothetical protein
VLIRELQALLSLVILADFLGRVTVNSPWLKLASILSVSTFSGIRKLRSKEPKRRSPR